MLNEKYESLLDQNQKILKDTSEALISKQLFKNNAEAVIYFTGLPDYNTLCAVVELVKDSAITPCTLNRFCQVVLCLMKLRLGSGTIDLAHRFRVSKTTVSRLFLHTINVFFIKLSPFIIWPERSEIIKTMPFTFKRKFGDKITSIIDCFELFIDRSSNLTARCLTWSSHKHNNTAKFLISITPQGTISFISKGRGGRTSDKVITENCGYLNKLAYGDTVMADRGFIIDDIVGSFGAHLEIPAFTRGKDQLSASEVITTRQLANVRIHVKLLMKYRIICFCSKFLFYF
nr:uncharacterized protein LOC124813958 [Hydra vulgaris]